MGDVWFEMEPGKVIYLRKSGNSELFLKSIKGHRWNQIPGDYLILVGLRQRVYIPLPRGGSLYPQVEVTFPYSIDDQAAMLRAIFQVMRYRHEIKKQLARFRAILNEIEKRKGGGE